MTTPISNNNSAVIANNRSAHSEGRTPQAQLEASTQIEHATAEQSEAAVTVSQAAQILNQSPADRVQGNIQNAEQAAVVAGQLKELFLQNPVSALAGQAGNVSPGIMGLLKTG